MSCSVPSSMRMLSRFIAEGAELPVDAVVGRQDEMPLVNRGA